MIGSGDVLSGLIASLIGKNKLNPFLAACAGVWFHGDLAKQFGPGLIAEDIIKNIFGTNDPNHPGVKNFLSSGKFLVSGDIQVLNYSYFPEEFPNTFATAVEIRKKLEIAGWSKTVAFQTRNPMHRAHEELCKICLLYTSPSPRDRG